MATYPEITMVTDYYYSFDAYFDIPNSSKEVQFSEMIKLVLLRE